MNEFLKFLQKAKDALGNLEIYKKIHLVLGNESCDLDSTVCAITLAYLIYSKKEDPNYIVIPVLNVDAKYFPLRTEVCYLLNQSGINHNTLIFKDQVDYTTISKQSSIQTTLVDHHVLAKQDKILEETVVEIIDHRPLNTKDICKNENLRTTIKIVGSCTTLIVHEIISSHLQQLFPKELINLLYATIIYDTIGLDKDCGKTFDEDITAIEYLEDLLKPQQSRKALFDTLWTIHNDTSNLRTKDLLYRDLKVVQGVPIPGLPLLVQDYLKRPDSDAAIKSFASEYHHKNAVLVGIDAAADVKRDLAIYFTEESFKDTLITILQTAGSELLLTEVPTQNKNIICFQQSNLKLSRKFILPLVNDAATKLYNDQ